MPGRWLIYETGGREARLWDRQLEGGKGGNHPEQGPGFRDGPWDRDMDKEHFRGEDADVRLGD